MIPLWLHALSWISLCAGGLCALIIAIDEARHRQPMWIMNAVWPLTALFGSVVWLWFYVRWGRPAGADRTPEDRGMIPFPVMVAKAASHCGSGCTLGDICAESLAALAPAVLVVFGWNWLFAYRIFAVWCLDFVLAYGFGIVFQYFTIAPMRHLSVMTGLRAAVRADTLSLIAWQAGMYGFMGFANFWLFPHGLHAVLAATEPEFWLMMQIAMMCGFVTSYPVNWWLLKARWKEKM